MYRYKYLFMIIENKLIMSEKYKNSMYLQYFITSLFGKNDVKVAIVKGRGYRGGLLFYFSGNFFSLFKYIQICTETSPKPPLLVQF